MGKQQNITKFQFTCVNNVTVPLTCISSFTQQSADRSQFTTHVKFMSLQLNRNGNKWRN